MRTELELQLVKLSWLSFPSHVLAAKDIEQMEVDQKMEQVDLTGKAI